MIFNPQEFLFISLYNYIRENIENIHMIRIGKYKYLVDLQEGSNVDSVSAYFILEFEYDNKFYVGWTGETNSASVKNKIDRLIYNAFHNVSWLSKSNPGLVKAIIESKYITVTTEEIPFNSLSLPNSLLNIYSRMYELIDEYTAYAPYGHNIINSLNKCVAEKAIISGYAAKWEIPDTIRKSGTGTTRSYPHRAVYQYTEIAENTYKFYKRWDSIKEYMDSTPTKVNPSAIYMCCNGQRRIAYGSVWRFNNADDIITIEPDLRKATGHRRLQNRIKKGMILEEKSKTILNKQQKYNNQYENR